MKKMICKKCYTLTTKKICPNCWTQTEVDNQPLNLEYPRLELNKITIYPYLDYGIILTIAIVLFGFASALANYGMSSEELFGKITVLCPAIFIAGIGIYILFLGICKFVKQYLVQVHGKTIEGTVIGYMNYEFDNEYIIEKILFNINNENKILLESSLLVMLETLLLLKENFL